MQLRWVSLYFGLLLSLDCAAAVQELADCAQVPEEIVFQRRIGGGTIASGIERHERYSERGWIVADFKNPERARMNGPSHTRNCSSWLGVVLTAAPPASRQRLSFRLKTVSFFGSGLADHLAIVLRASFALVEGVQGGTPSGRGLAMFPTATYAESFPGSLGSGATMALADDVEYSVEMIATRDALSFLIVGPEGKVAETTWRDANSFGTAGYGFAVLCAYSQNASCEYPEGSSFARVPFEVRFSDISLTWSIDDDDGTLPRFAKRPPRPPAFGAAFAR